MDNFQLFKLKKAGLTNLNVLHILAYQKKKGKSLSLRDMAVVSKCRDPLLFIENYKNLKSKELRDEFNRFPSLSILDKDYPLELKNIYNPPALLFYQGDLELMNRPKLAVVGSRNVSKTGVDSVKKIIRELENRFVIVSGLARGVDTAAHLASLKNGGATIAVIGAGLDVYYPKENRQLQSYIAKNHLLLSEYAPNSQPLKYHFPERNRIIAGLSRGVVVAEAKIRSGSLITCERALEEGRDVFAVPGNILDGQSDGCHHLIQEGAKCTTSGMDVLNEYQLRK
ncbi:DNA-processing protein DprA [Streptococcus ratti]|uniref:DNA-protecting protein DprA n=2 Tax=Streptococcus ratti TaxID=1341 RepID=A0A7X9QG60_STRRT|nr:DNA-processing protein DprA [Streptococcus ratti]VEI60205.1 DNA processing Smf protein [Streptococcus mutans]EJN93896.1 putative DNA processing Smf protein [Streptococcus ratti FA-1 = DSM 20564]EMP71172.1 putative DNA processing Smf protein [Streptococcus ratti FA-1 = DSM 20564]NMD48132.1 DNA-protecting protein DprA [Streptococcus ratti]QEY07743.1 DNA-protecting protein DprA [Streptococcus ratti]